MIALNITRIILSEINNSLKLFPHGQILLTYYNYIYNNIIIKYGFLINLRSNKFKDQSESMKMINR